MRRLIPSFAAVAAVVVLLAVATGPTRAGISKADGARIRSAVPDDPPARPARPRKVLIYSRCTGYHHSAIPYAIEALRLLGETTGAYEAVVSDDLANFAPEKLAKFDAIVLNNTTGELFLPHGKLPDDQNQLAKAHGREFRQALLDFVAGGKGLVGLHAATDCSYNWPAFGRLIGGYFDGHPWNEKVGVVIDEPNHPLTASFEGKGFTVADEIYQFKAPWSRRRLRVLLSLDMGRTPAKGKRSDGDYAVSWVKPYGRGRVFYCSLGHRKEIYFDRSILAHWLAGIQYALGDLPADDTPSAPPVADGPGWQTLFDGADLSAWDARPGGWHVADGTLAWAKGAGFLWSKETYGDFVLDLEFKVSQGANSGIFLRTGSRKNWLHTGMEVQVLDSHAKADPGKHDGGAIYDCLAPEVNAVRPPGQWNRAVITCRGPSVQVILNGQPVIDMNLDRWTQPHRNPDGSRNKFNTAYKDLPRSGYIGLQDHGRPVWYRNIRIRPLKPTGEATRMPAGK
jgi:hypothetical protein